MTHLVLLSFAFCASGLPVNGIPATRMAETVPALDTLFTLSSLAYPTAEDCSTPVWEERGTYDSAQEFVVPKSPGLYRVEAKVYTEEGGFVRVEKEYAEYFGALAPSKSYSPPIAASTVDSWRGPGCERGTAWAAGSTIHVVDNEAVVIVYDAAGRMLRRAAGNFENDYDWLPSGVYVVAISKGEETCAIVMPIVSN